MRFKLMEREEWKRQKPRGQRSAWKRNLWNKNEWMNAKDRKRAKEWTTNINKNFCQKCLQNAFEYINVVVIRVEDDLVIKFMTNIYYVFE